MGTMLRGRRIAIGVLDPPLCRSIQASLQRESAEVSAHGSLDGVLDAVASSRPVDLCILDVDLPGLSIRANVELLRTLAVRIPVVLLTGHLPPAEPGPLADLPTLTLPFGRASLIALLERLLGRP